MPDDAPGSPPEDDLPDEVAPGEVPLPVFPVRVRFRRAAEVDDALVLAGLARQLEALGLPGQVRVERTEPDGTVLAEARIPTVSVDAHTAVAGVHEALTDGGLDVDEAWVQPEPAGD